MAVEVHDGATSRTKQGCRDYLANLYHQQTGNTI
jgi:hypothetical protein